MQTQPVYLIAREGWKIITFFALLFVLEWLLVDASFLNLILFCLTVGALLFFRNPERTIPDEGEGTTVAPVDGEIVDLIRDEAAKQLHIVIRTSVFDTHIVRAAKDMKVKTVLCRKGLFLGAKSAKMKALNMRSQVQFEAGGNDTVYTFYPNSIPFEPVFNLRGGESVKSGSRIGVIGNGVTVLTLGFDTALKINLGDRVKAGETIIGFIRR